MNHPDAITKFAAITDADTSPRSPRFRRAIHLMSILAALVVSLPLGEAVVRLKNRSMTNYQIEMWRYSRELKHRSDNPVLGHEHVTNAAAILQNVNIRLNEWGLRGESAVPRSPDKRRILVLGSSITLGWGVAEAETFTAQLHDMFEASGDDVEVLNAGIGNYNAVRYVELFLTKLHALQPSDIVVHYFMNDAEELEPGGGNFLLEHSQLAATIWTMAKQQQIGTGETGFIEHYREV